MLIGQVLISTSAEVIAFNCHCSLIMNTQMDTLKQREQLMEDIDSICDDFFYSNYNGDISEAEELVRMLCDAVCKNFPTK